MTDSEQKDKEALILAIIEASQGLFTPKQVKDTYEIMKGERLPRTAEIKAVK